MGGGLVGKLVETSAVKTRERGVKAALCQVQLGFVDDKEGGQEEECCSFDAEADVEDWCVFSSRRAAGRIGKRAREIKCVVLGRKGGAPEQGEMADAGDDVEASVRAANTCS